MRAFGVNLFVRNISQDYIDGRAEYVTVGMDSLPEIVYGTRLCSPELNEHYGMQIPLQVINQLSKYFLLRPPRYGTNSSCVSPVDAPRLPSMRRGG